MAKWVYSFGDGKAEGRADMRNLLGGKGANLAEMSSLGLPVPPGFTITTEVCTYYYANDNTYPPELKDEVEKALVAVEKIVGAEFGDANNPLLVSVRSGARASMPGMMDTVLNLGLNDSTVQGLAKSSGDERFAWDSYRRFIQMYSRRRARRRPPLFRGGCSSSRRRSAASTIDTELKADDWRWSGRRVQEDRREAHRQAVPAGAARAAVGRDRRGVRLVDEPARHHLPPPATTSPTSWGTAVNVQAMVFGNMGDDCATGVAFTRDPSTGDNVFYGEYLVNAQGEDVVAGIRTPQPSHRRRARRRRSPTRLPWKRSMPEVFKQLDGVREHARDALPRHAGHRVHRRSAASSTCCRRATASAPPRPRSRSRSTWCARA